ncbi:MAG: hypothetical protein PUC59_05505 [Firmicutes bacterium]|nr:hypothetical protein [Bacillota bacterium]
MTDKELRKLSRGELLEMLIAQSKQLQSLEKKLEDAEAALRKKEIAIDRAGSLAEAALQLNGVFEAAEAACEQYTENIRSLSRRQEEICARMEAESSAKAKSILDAAEKKRTEMERDTEQRCAEMTEKARAEAQAYWDTVSDKLEAFLAEHSELRQLLFAAVPQSRDYGHETK